MNAEPDYACAIIEDDRHRLLLDLRPAQARHAADLLTCFGGRREPDEDVLACLRRELREELGWSPPSCLPCCDLRVGGRTIASFYRCPWDRAPLTCEGGHRAIWAPRSSLAGLPLSPWHAQVLMAVAEGITMVELP